jgi:hypothetical protein
MENKISANVGRNLINCHLSILIFTWNLLEKWFSLENTKYSWQRPIFLKWERRTWLLGLSLFLLIILYMQCSDMKKADDGSNWKHLLSLLKQVGQVLIPTLLNIFGNYSWKKFSYAAAATDSYSQFFLSVVILLGFYFCFFFFLVWRCFLCIQSLLLPLPPSWRKKPFHAQKHWRHT